MKKYLLVAASAAVGLIFMASWSGTAQAATHSIKATKVAHAAISTSPLHPVLPGGLTQSNPVVAQAQLMSRATVDPKLGQRLAHSTGAASFNPADYRAIGYGKATGTNTGVDNQGNFVAARDTSRCHRGAKVLILLNIRTQGQAEICTGCANPRIRAIIAHLPQRPWAVGTVMAFHRYVTKPVSIRCPSGQKVFGQLKVSVNGVIRANSWGELQGKMSVKIRAQVRAAISAQVTLRCGLAPAKPLPVKPGNCNVVVNGNNNVVNNCVFVINVCGATFIGSNSQKVSDQAQAWVNINCVGTPVPPPAKPASPFTVNVSKHVQNTDGSDITATYAKVWLPIHLYVNGQPVFNTFVLMNGVIYTFSQDGKVAYLFPAGSTVTACEDLNFIRKLNLMPVAPVESNGCMAATSTTTLGFVNRVIPSIPPPPKTCQELGNCPPVPCEQTNSCPPVPCSVTNSCPPPNPCSQPIQPKFCNPSQPSPPVTGSNNSGVDVPGSSPPDPTNGNSGSTNPDGSVPGGGQSPCPEGFVSDPNTGCTPA